MPTSNKVRRREYQIRKSNGLCPRCGAKKKKSYKFILCGKCLGFFRTYQEEIAFDKAAEKREQYNLLKKQHKCTRCGKQLSKAYRNSRCRQCLDKQYSYAKNIK